MHSTREKLEAERVVLQARLQEITTELQALCEHKWVWHQVAGEGQICHKCGLRNFDVDD